MAISDYIISMLNIEQKIISTIERFAPSSKAAGSSIGDDAAFIKLTSLKKKYLVVSTDQLVEGVHFTWNWSSPQDVAYKLVQMNLSDILVKGAIPCIGFLNLQLSPSFVDNFENIINFSQMFGDCLKEYGISLMGGDTTSSSTNSFGLTILGESNQYIPRSSDKLQKDDLLILLGCLGGSAFALEELKAHQGKPTKIQASLSEYYRRPKAQWEGRFLLKSLESKVSIDTSDSLYESLHILSQENQAELSVFVDQICCPQELKDINFSSKLKYLLGGGEDFAILMIVPPTVKKQIDTLSRYHSNLRIIGNVVSVGETSDVQYLYKNKEIEVNSAQIRHFLHF